jgi:predicted aconitase with swiveling domain
MSRIFKGRAILPRPVEGDAVVTHSGFNTLASFYKSILTKPEVAICSDQDNKELFGKPLTDKMVCLPKTIGSTSAGATIEYVAYLGIAPRAMLYSQKIDSLSAAGLVLADVWAGERICAIDQLGDDFLEYVKDGHRIVAKEDGTVIVD